MDIAQLQKPGPGELFLDHVSHFVPDLELAAQALEKLGFHVTPRSDQVADGKPAGTANRCVMLEQGYIELLAPTHETAAAHRMRERMAQFVGVHLACFGTPDAEGEHARLRAHAFDPQPIVELERRLEEASVQFRVVRPAPDRMPEGRIQYVQQLTPEAIWTRRNLAHRNGARALTAVYVCSEDPARAAARWARFSGLLPRAAPQWVELVASRGSVVIASKRALQTYGGFAALPPAPALAGYALRCRNPSALARQCAAAGLAVAEKRGHFTVALPPALGGAWVLWGQGKGTG